MNTTQVLHDLQNSLHEEIQRLESLQNAFRVENCADESDTATCIEAAHIAQCSALRSVQRIHDLQSLQDILRYGGPRYCEDCGEEIPIKRLLAAPGTTRCHQCQENFEESMQAETRRYMPATDFYKSQPEYC